MLMILLQWRPVFFNKVSSHQGYPALRSQGGVNQITTCVPVAVDKSHYRPVEVFFRYDADGNGMMSLQEFEAALEEMEITCPSELALVAFKHIDSNDDGNILIDEMMTFMRRYSWWRTSSPRASPRSGGSTSPPIPAWSDVTSSERAAMYATSAITQLHSHDREQAIEEAAQAVWQEARERVERAASPTNGSDSPPTIVDANTTSLNNPTAEHLKPNSALMNLSAREIAAIRAQKAFGDEHLGWGRASP